MGSKVGAVVVGATVGASVGVALVGSCVGEGETDGLEVGSFANLLLLLVGLGVAK